MSGQHVVGDHRGLLAHGGGGFGIGGSCTSPSDQMFSKRLCCSVVWIDIDPAGGIGQRADALMKSGAVCGGTTWIMSKDFSTISLLPPGVGDLEPGLFRRAVDPTRLCMKLRSAVFFDVFIKRGHIVLDAEQHAAGIAELDVDVSEAARPPVIARQIERLLRRAGAFDRHRRLGENRLARFQALHQLPGIGRQIDSE
jgi:hypothetical protein